MEDGKKFKDYIGKTIKNFIFDNEVLKFEFTDKTKEEFHAVGDCCSHSWFEQISGDEALWEGATITRIEFIDMPNSAVNEDEYEVLQTYGLKIVTDKGYCDIEMRNESNGYYGGFINIGSYNQYSHNTTEFAR